MHRYYVAIFTGREEKVQHELPAVCKKHLFAAFSSGHKQFNTVLLANVRILARTLCSMFTLDASERAWKHKEVTAVWGNTFFSSRSKINLGRFLLLSTHFRHKPTIVSDLNLLRTAEVWIHGTKTNPTLAG